MKKFLSMVSIAALALTASCSEDQTTDPPFQQKDCFHATIEELTRTALSGTTVVWSADDKIAVLTDDDTSVVEEYVLATEAGASRSAFYGNPLTGSGQIYVAYPNETLDSSRTVNSTLQSPPSRSLPPTALPTTYSQWWAVRVTPEMSCNSKI